MLVSSTTRRALSTGMVRFFTAPTISPKIPKYWYFTIKISVKPPQIRVRTLFRTFKASSKYNSTCSIQWYGQIFHSANHVSKNPKILVFSHENRSKTTPDSSRNIVPNFPCLFHVQIDELCTMLWSDFP